MIVVVRVDIDNIFFFFSLEETVLAFLALQLILTLPACGQPPLKKLLSIMLVLSETQVR